MEGSVTQQIIKCVRRYYHVFKGSMLSMEQFDETSKSSVKGGNNMTQNQIAYQAHRETARANRAKEALTAEQNAETKRSNLARETETNRHNVVTEQESYRHNVVGENISLMTLFESSRHNQATEQLGRDTLGETTRHNKATEGIEQFKANNQREYWNESLQLQADYNKKYLRNQGMYYSGLLENQQTTNSINAYRARKEYELGLGNLGVAEQNAQANLANAKTNAKNALTNRQNSAINQYNAETSRFESYGSVWNDFAQGSLASEKKKWVWAEGVKDLALGAGQLINSLASMQSSVANSVNAYTKMADAFGLVGMLS